MKNILDRVGAVGERPEHRVGIFRIDVLAHGDDVFADIGLQGRGAMQRAPDFRARHPRANWTKTIFRKLLSGSCMATRRTPLIASVFAQMREKTRLVGGAFITLDSLASLR